ncbi:MAG: hypothetical protein DMD37_12495 [Gemmatimonadetes bacterium]|nr:MAG: hypothetical protein DMD71_13385 [Gemmatimonadota bacterium]PYO84913.1 MAG: hypothetical protein DMD68_05190 [Gemmatimonadota bacterium]PYP61777.1 MAG: hypothetical protein DMD37_12495 [Gemmatimonadota bacterium]
MWGIPSWAIGVAVIMLAISLGRGLTAMFGGGMLPKRGKGDGATDAELARQAEALEEAQRRLAELEERMDFAERLLAKQRDGERLAPPRS